LPLQFTFNIQEITVSANPISPITAQTNGGIAPKAPAAQAAPAASNASVTSSDLAKLRLLVTQHVPLATIAQRLGKSVSAIRQEAAAAGINLNANSTSGAAPAGKTGTGAVGNSINVKA
jgi:hypothetical protein